MNEQSTLPFTLGERYECKEQIGFGGMGSVYLARDMHLGRDVAIKLLRVATMQEDETQLNKERFRREARALSMLRHPNTIQLFDFGWSSEGLPFIVTELLQGRGLDELLSAEKRLRPERAVPIVAQVCMSLSEAHDVGIVHRDLKPSNIFLIDAAGADDFVKLIDFGVARMNDSTDSSSRPLTAEGTTLGTPNYMAPEQARGLRPTSATDVYALGCLLFEMISGRLPFIAKSSHLIMIQHVQESPPTLKSIAPGVSLPAGLQDVVTRTMAKEPTDRPANAAELLSLLQNLKLGETGEMLATEMNTTAKDIEQQDKTRLDIEMDDTGTGPKPGGATVLLPNIERPRAAAAINPWKWIAIGLAVIAIAALAILLNPS